MLPNAECMLNRARPVQARLVTIDERQVIRFDDDDDCHYLRVRLCMYGNGVCNVSEEEKCTLNNKEESTRK
ncbi:hypothetical protein PCURB6_35370 [Paenibacillus curdlanolyticus]|nr:hypothetical protein PCURB6_35370 [Paenibacillus curdlanolyticus]